MAKTIEELEAEVAKARAQLDALTAQGGTAAAYDARIAKLEGALNALAEAQKKRDADEAKADQEEAAKAEAAAKAKAEADEKTKAKGRGDWLSWYGKPRDQTPPKA